MKNTLTIKKYPIQYLLVVVLICYLPFSGQAQVAKSNKGTFALTNATIVTVTKGTIENGTLVIQDGKIAAVGNSVTIPTSAKTIDCTGLSIYPGMIDSGTQLGMAEVNAVSLTVDHNEIGDIKPQMQALTAINPNNVAIPVTRVNGVTTVLSVPTGGIMPGTAALINLIGYTPNQMYAGFKGVAINYPSTRKRGWRDKRTEEERKKEEEKDLKKLNDILEQARLYAKIDSAAQKDISLRPEYNPQMEALLPVVQGKIPVLIEVNKEKSIESAIKWVEKNKVKAIFTGVAEGWRVAEQLATSKIPVITGPMLNMPTRASDRYDRPYANAGVMHKAGVKVAIRTNDSENVRNLPFNAGFAAAYGMGKEAALKAVTITPAEIFGIADQLGSLEAGKLANLLVTDGDPFETKTQISYLFINGWQVPIDSRHIQLYEEFLDRSPGLKK